MVGANQYKDKHELQSWSIFFVIMAKAFMKGKTVEMIVNKERGR
jgi:hypothetical protein